jgi:hypothetical protein
MDVFVLHVEHVSGHGAMAEAPKVSVVEVRAWTVSDASLVALEMVAARGRVPVSVAVDWAVY